MVPERLERGGYGVDIRTNRDCLKLVLDETYCEAISIAEVNYPVVCLDVEFNCE